ncbi:hypothetical protein [Shimia thalassica]|uniref:hypothetical protein n=1 Tax=Shimia thalassica TaxID=1715693 RepID=UPI0026E41C35|nr:hypothetical protein [Shimia thalassica]MDO6485657.1 hypothetical protein [Shimia thalassica]
MTRFCTLAGALGLMTAPLMAQEGLSGTKTIYLLEKDAKRHEIGQVDFADDGTYAVRLHEHLFEDHFLSMRPFKCLEGNEKQWCYVPYPYANNRRIDSADLTDLEYDLLFLWRGASDYGINMWNGVYYSLSFEENHLIGTLNEVDMDVLSAPPEDGEMRPIKSRDLHEADPDSHWLPGLIIE